MPSVDLRSEYLAVYDNNGERLRKDQRPVQFSGATTSYRPARFKANSEYVALPKAQKDLPVTRCGQEKQLAFGILDNQPLNGLRTYSGRNSTRTPSQAIVDITVARHRMLHRTNSTFKRTFATLVVWKRETLGSGSAWKPSPKHFAIEGLF